MRSDWLIHLVSRTREKLRFYLSAELRSVGLKDFEPAHGAVLFALSAAQPLTMQRLAQLTERDASTMTVLVRKLRSRGYLASEKGSADQRESVISLTPKGAKAVPLVRRASARVLRRAYRGVSRAERALVISLLQRIHANL